MPGLPGARSRSVCDRDVPRPRCEEPAHFLGVGEHEDGEAMVRRDVDLGAAERDVANRHDREREGLRAVPRRILRSDREHVPPGRLQHAVDAAVPGERAVQLLAAREPGLAAPDVEDAVPGAVQRVADAEGVVPAVAVGGDVRVDAVREPHDGGRRLVDLDRVREGDRPVLVREVDDRQVGAFGEERDAVDADPGELEAHLALREGLPGDDPCDPLARRAPSTPGCAGACEARRRCWRRSRGRASGCSSARTPCRCSSGRSG